MDIGELVRHCGDIDVAPLAAAIAAQGEEAWDEHKGRQKDYEVHRQTQSIVLLFANIDQWPTIEVTRPPGWDRLAGVATPLMDSIIARWYPPGGRIIRAMVAKLPPGARIDPHRDRHPSFGCGHRIHAPVTTNSRSAFRSMAGRITCKWGRCTRSIISRCTASSTEAAPIASTLFSITSRLTRSPVRRNNYRHNSTIISWERISSRLARDRGKV